MMSAYDFGKQLILTEDLDPVYVLLHKSKLSATELARYLLAYWWFYSMGTAAQILDAADFYSAALEAAGSRATRGSERRHFRGAAAINTVLWFQKTFPDPVQALSSLRHAKTFLQVKALVLEWPLFGPWISFKVADMLERVLGWPVDFSDCDLLEFYAEPRAGAELLASRDKTTPAAALKILSAQLRELDAPPDHDRPCGIQEVETVLCKWKSYTKGHYYVGKDWKEVRHGLEGKGRTAEALLRLAPVVPEQAGAAQRSFF